MSDVEWPSEQQRRLTRRNMLIGAGLVGAGISGKWAWDHTEGFMRASTFIARAETYERDLERVILNGLKELRLDSEVTGKRILLKPNLVEPTVEAPHINTHPLFIRAVAAVLLRLGAKEVLVAEGQGHCRDSHLVLEQSGLAEVLGEDTIRFQDLNHDGIHPEPNRLGVTTMSQLYLPDTLRRVDWIVSLPKLKTHHWAGATLSMKNLFGVMPGIYYGWPKNVLHHAGIAGSILDITATVKPNLAIVDGIIAMEGDGPIMGTPRHCGLIIMGANLPAVDATAARIMSLDPYRIEYLVGASGRLGPIDETHIQQRGERIDQVAHTFELLDHPMTQRFR